MPLGCGTWLEVGHWAGNLECFVSLPSCLSCHCDMSSFPPSDPSCLAAACVLIPLNSTNQNKSSPPLSQALGILSQRGGRILKVTKASSMRRFRFFLAALLLCDRVFPSPLLYEASATSGPSYTIEEKIFENSQACDKEPGGASHVGFQEDY